jgi:Phosphate-selective porin O and P
MQRKMLLVGLVVLLFAVSRNANASEEGFNLKISGYVQAWYLSDSTPGAVNEFKINRARLNFTGQVIDPIQFAVSLEPTDSGHNILRDAYAVLRYIPYVDFQAGQFKVPFGIEGPESLSVLPTINRSIVFGILFPSVRDIGAMVSGRGSVGDALDLGYQVAVMNGTGQNTADTNDRKDVVGRVWAHVLKTVMVGLSDYTGEAKPAATNTPKDRLGADLEVRTAAIPGLLVRGEYYWGRDDTTRKYGWYALGAYRIQEGFLRNVEGVVRYEQFDPTRGVSNDLQYRTTVGATYYFVGQTKFVLNYEFKKDQADADHDASSNHNQLIAELQVKF